MQVPGYVDLQLNGAFGIDLAAEPERLWELAALLPLVPDALAEAAGWR